MRICLIALHFVEYGYRLATALAERHDVLFIATKQGFQNEVEEGWVERNRNRLETLLITDYKLRHPQMPISAFRIWNAVRKFRPDIIHCQEAYRDYLMMVLPYLHTCPLVLTIHDPVPHSGDDAESIGKHRFRHYRESLRRRAQAAIVHGERIRAEAESLIPRLRGRVFAVPHGILGDVVKPSGADWHPGELLFFGRVEKYKGLGFFLDALDILKKEGLMVHGVVAGRGSDLINFHDRIVASPHVTLIDRYILPQEIPQLFRHANVVVLPYTDATQSGVAAYALRYGRPVVATDVGSLPETVRHGINGLLVQPGDTRALVGAIRSLVTQPALAASLAAQAAHLAETEFSWETISWQTERVYGEVLAECRIRA